MTSSFQLTGAKHRGKLRAMRTPQRTGRAGRRGGAQRDRRKGGVKPTAEEKKAHDACERKDSRESSERTGGVTGRQQFGPLLAEVVDPQKQVQFEAILDLQHATHQLSV